MPTRVRAVRFERELLEELEQHLSADGEDLSRFVNAAVERALHGDERAVRRPAGLHVVPDLGPCAEGYRHALLARDARRARAVIEDAVHRGAAIVDVYGAVIEPALHEIGDLWSLDEITVAQEHFATETTVQIIAALAPDRRLAPTRGRLAIVGGSPEELHAIGARMVADVLERAGWEVIGLGAATPAEDLYALVADEQPDLVALSTATIGRLPGAEDAVQRLAALQPRPVIAVGGGLYTGGVDGLARDWGAEIVTSDLRALLGELAARFPPV
jgi:methanogenic corrinoid protein MtbC1